MAPKNIEDNLKETVRESLNKLPKDIVVLLRSQNLLRSLVQRMVIDQACESVQLPAEKLDQAIASFCKQHGLSDEERLERYLSHQELIKSDLIHQLGIPLKVHYLSLKEFTAKTESHFLKSKEELDQFTNSLLRVEDSDLALEQKIISGLEFLSAKGASSELQYLQQRNKVRELRVRVTKEKLMAFTKNQSSIKRLNSSMPN